MVRRRLGAALAFGLAVAAALLPPNGARAQATVTIATVNNGDMVVMQRLAPQFERQNPNIRLRWVVLEENVLRQRVTTDIATRAGQFDILTIGNYEVPIWAKQGWLSAFDNLPAGCCVEVPCLVDENGEAKVVHAEGGAKVVWVNYVAEKSVPLPATLKALGPAS